jgi:hypothetical protein
LIYKIICGSIDGLINASFSLVSIEIFRFDVLEILRKKREERIKEKIGCRVNGNDCHKNGIHEGSINS